MATPSAFDFNADNGDDSFSPLRAVFRRKMAVEMENGKWLTANAKRFLACLSKCCY